MADEHVPAWWRLSRRDLGRLAWASAGMVVAGPGLARAAPASKAGQRGAPDQILRSLLEGNQRFVAGQVLSPRRRPEDFAALAERQTPLAVIVGCADSRVPPELVFDQGVGDLFVVRVAGNLVSRVGFIVRGSIEYAVAELGVPLILILGHTSCGAVKAALKHIDAGDALAGSIKELVNSFRPVVATVKNRPGDPLDNAIRANVERGVERLKTLEPILAPAVRGGRLKVAGGVYDLKSGGVTVIA